MRPTLAQLERLNSCDGTEAIVYIDNDYVYRVVGLDRYEYTKYRSIIGHNIPHLVKIFDVWKIKDRQVYVVKMERLYEVPMNKYDSVEREKFYNTNIYNIKELKKYKTTCPVLAEVLRVQIEVAEAMGESIVDSGPHNIMFNKKSKFVVIDPM